MMKVAPILHLHVSHARAFGSHFSEFVLVCTADLGCEVRDTNEVQNPDDATIGFNHGRELREFGLTRIGVGVVGVQIRSE